MIIGVSGKARVGKNQFTEYLIGALYSKYEIAFKEDAFANALKKICEKNFNMSYHQLWGNSKEVEDRRYPKITNEDGSITFWTPREVMQEIGSFYRSIDADFWLKQVDIKRGVVITDVRHVNEVEYIKNNGGINIKIVRDSTSEIHGSDHISETALDDYDEFDIVVDNNGSLADLSMIAVDVSDMIMSTSKLIKIGGAYNGKER